MGYNGLNLGLGVQRLIDAQQRYIQNSRYPISIRLRNFTNQQSQAYVQFGFVISPSGANVGTTDIPINPPPSTRLISQHNIGMSQGKLRFGAREFIISGSFVTAQQSALGLARPELLWSCSQFMGVVAYGTLYTVEEWAPEEVGGLSVIWTLKTNSNEQK